MAKIPISADSHITEPRNCYIDYIDPSFRDRAPHVATSEKYGDVYVDTKKSMDVYREWKALTRPADKFSPDGTRRPYWFKRPLKPTRETYNLPGYNK